MFGGGGGVGDPNMAFRTNSPRLTGDVRSGFEVTTSTVPSVSTPPRGQSGGRVTRRISLPVTPRLVRP